jgi:hypothetical protein
MDCQTAKRREKNLNNMEKIKEYETQDYCLPIIA